MRLIEWVPNFSEGRDQAAIDAIVDAISDHPVHVLHVDAGHAVNRTVVTVVGEPGPLLESAFSGIARAAEQIDMQTQTGVHPRIGATDVSPFIPYRSTSLQDCVELANQLGQRVGNELGIPIFLYGEAATEPRRRNLSWIRRGEYEGLAEKLARPEWRPDYGPLTFNARSGATAIGARELLVAFNVNLDTRDIMLAREIAAAIRSRGHWEREQDGSFRRDRRGKRMRRPGLLRHCKAIGWFIEEYDCCQVTMNLTNYRQTTLHDALEVVRELAADRRIALRGTELVGMVPLEAMRASGAYYLDNARVILEDEELVEIAADRLQLDGIRPFDPARQVLEFALSRSEAQKKAARRTARP